MATVEIVIRGIGISYQKKGDWQILFPVDEEECHKVNFTFRKDGESASEPTSLAKSKTIKVTAQGATSQTGEAQNFQTEIYDLTSASTHEKIRLKENPGRFALMSVSNAQLSADKKIVGPIPDIVEVGTKNKKPVTNLSLAAKATITLGEGGQVTVEADGFNFTTEPGASYIITIDNDCDRIKNGTNDMDLYYDVIEEFDPVTGKAIERKFRIGGVGIAPKKLSKRDKSILEGFRILKDPPNLAGGNTCLFAKVTDEDSIGNLPPN